MYLIFYVHSVGVLDMITVCFYTLDIRHVTAIHTIFAVPAAPSWQSRGSTTKWVTVTS
jgi:hypothetical protein